MDRTFLYLQGRLGRFVAFGRYRFLDLLLDDWLGGDGDGHGDGDRFRDDWRRGDFGVI